MGRISVRGLISSVVGSDIGLHAGNNNSSNRFTKKVHSLGSSVYALRLVGARSLDVVGV